MTKKRTTRKVTVQSPTEIIARNREIDNNIEIILTYQLIQKLVDIRNDGYKVKQAEATDLFEIVFVIRKLSEYIKTTKLKTQAEAIEILDEYIEESNALFERLNEETKNYNQDKNIIEYLKEKDNLIIFMNPPFFKLNSKNESFAYKNYGNHDSTALFFYRILKASWRLVVFIGFSPAGTGIA